MRIDIREDSVVIDGTLYRKVFQEDTEKVGRQWIASYLGCTGANLSTKPWLFPDFGEGFKLEHKPYRKCDVMSWLAIPSSTRKQMYQKHLEEKEIEADQQH